MSLWTPGGEHEVPRERADAPDRSAADAPAGPGGPSAPAVSPDDLLAALSPEDRAQLAAMSPEERARAEAMLQEMAAVQQQMLETPAAVVVVNHAMGLYELATIHLRTQPANFDEAKVAIDAFGALVESLQGRLGPDEPTLIDALNQLRLAFVQLKEGVEADAAAAAAPGAAGPPDEPGAAG